MKRIKYKEMSPGIYESVYIIESKSGSQYNIIINKPTCQYKIQNIKSGRIYHNLNNPVTNIKVMHRHLRAQLELLGVVFEYEEQAGH